MCPLGPEFCPKTLRPEFCPRALVLRDFRISHPRALVLRGFRICHPITQFSHMPPECRCPRPLRGGVLGTPGVQEPSQGGLSVHRCLCEPLVSLSGPSGHPRPVSGSQRGTETLRMPIRHGVHDHDAQDRAIQDHAKDDHASPFLHDQYPAVVIALRVS